MKKQILILAALALPNCGGGGSSSPFTTDISGGWRIVLRQVGCLRCNDNSVQCVGNGSVTRNSIVEINTLNDPAPGSETVNVEFDSCTYTGTRTSDSSVTTTAASPCTGTITLSEIADETIQMTRNAGSPPAAPPLGCVIDEAGVLERE